MRDGDDLHVHGEDEGEGEKNGQAPDGDEGQDGRRHLRRGPRVDVIKLLFFFVKGKIS